MSTPRRTLVAVILAFLALVNAPLSAQTDSEFERVLVPVVLPPSGIDGAFGALWVTRFWIRNNAHEPVSVRPFDYGCQLATCPPPPPLEPGGTFYPQVSGAGPARGLVLSIEKNFVEEVALSVRTYDTSRATKSWGTELPIVRESRFTRTEILLLDVPRDPRFRAALRIYSLSPQAGQQARVRIYRLDSSRILPPAVPDQVLADHVVPLLPPEEGLSAEAYPSSTFLDLQPMIPQTDAEHLIVSVQAVTAQPMWAFVSVTNNETQEITTISPQP